MNRDKKGRFSKTDPEIRSLRIICNELEKHRTRSDIRMKRMFSFLTSKYLNIDIKMKGN